MGASAVLCSTPCSDEPTKYLLPERDIPTHRVNLLPVSAQATPAPAESADEGAGGPR
jgi:hypothetical protein